MINIFSRLLTPLILICVCIISSGAIFQSIFLKFILILFFVYLFPILVYRILSRFYPIKEGSSYLGKNFPINGWVIAHRCQGLFYTFEILERVLRLVPGLYSFWLRLWGSSIGKNVYWTPHTRVGDRTHLCIGDNVLIGNASYLSPHIVKKCKDEEGKYLLYIKKIILEDNSLVGTHSTLGPGAVVKKGESTPGFSIILKNKIQKLEIVDA